MSDYYVGEIRLFAGLREPANWAFCDGRTLAISGLEVLFSLIGTTYGGNGQTTFALPDLRGRVPVGQVPKGQAPGPGLTPWQMGQTFGSPTVTLAADQIPPHNHPLQGSSTSATSADPKGNVLATTPSKIYDTPSDEPEKVAAFSSKAVGSEGGDQSHENMMPYLALNYIIALNGLYPSRS